jgi:hypothetical protein
MLLLSPYTEGTTVTDPRFSSRGFPKNRQGPISGSPILAIALEHQLAYSGYKDNIDIFLAATALNKTYTINIPGLDIDEKHFNFTFPLDLPRTVISFRPDVPADFIEKTISQGKKAGITQVRGLKSHPQCYLVDYPTIKFLNFVQAFTVATAPRHEGYCQIKECLQAAKILGMIDLYLRTNTYPAFKDDKDVFNFRYGSIAHPSLTEKRPAFFTGSQLTKKPRYGNVTMTHDVDGKEREEKGTWFGVESDKDVAMDVATNGYVMIAKASPAKTSQASWSAPKDVPALPGLCFPYFQGMLTNDKSILRIVPGTHFMRLFGSDPRPGYLAYRNIVGGFASTNTGIIMTHILTGLDMSVETQTKLHLLFDGKMYLGFCLLGSKWAVQRGQQWHLPKTSAELRADLDTIKTHESSLAEVVAKLEDLDIMNSIEDSCDLASALALIDWNKVGGEEEQRDLQRWFDERVGRLDFGTRPVNFGVDTLLAALTDIIHVTEPLDNHIHFPPAREYHLFNKREAVCLARFGYLVPSFEIDKGVDSIRLSSLHADKESGDKHRKAVNKVLIAMKPLNKAVQDFKVFRNMKRIFQSSSERAASYRLHALGGQPKDRFLKEMGLVIQKLETDNSHPSRSAAVVDTGAGPSSSSVPFVRVEIPDSLFD